MLPLKTTFWGPQFTWHYLIEKSIHLLSPWHIKHYLCQMICVRPPLVKMLFIVFFYCLCEYVAHGNYFIFIFYIWQRNEAVNRYIEIQIHLCLYHLNLVKKRNISCVRIVHYTSHILVKILHSSQHFFHMLTLKTHNWM